MYETYFKKCLFKLELAIILMINIYNCLNCDKYSCNKNMPSGQCMTAERFNWNDNNTNSTYLNFKIETNKCPSGQTCSYSSASILDTNSSSIIFNCINKTVDQIKVDGESCILSNECYSGKCENKKCVGKTTGEACGSTLECESETFCDNKTRTCLDQRDIGQNCTIDEECVNEAGCLHGKCVEFFSLAPGIPLNQSAEIYCNTSYAYENKCASLINVYDVPFPCVKDSCVYVVPEIEKYVDLPNLCSCGYNSGQNKYCQLGSDTNIYQAYKEQYLNILKIRCHVSKKFSCNKINVKDIMYLQFLSNAWKGKLQIAEDCVVDFFSKADTNKINLFLMLAIFITILF